MNFTVDTIVYSAALFEHKTENFRKISLSKVILVANLLN
jgi:hypothetical protein